MKKLTMTIRDTFRAITSSFGDTFFICMGPVCGSIFAAIVVSGQPDYNSWAEKDQIQTMVIATVSTAIVFFIINILIQNPIYAAREDKLARSWIIGITAAVIFILFKLFINRIGYSNQNSNLLNENYLVIILVCFIAPIIEEYFFRGLIWRLYRDRNISELAILLATTLLFAFGHLAFNAFDLIQISVAGLCLGAMRMFTGSVYLGILVHGITNAIVLFNL